MSKDQKSGMWVYLDQDTMIKLGVIIQATPRDENGRKISKKSLVEDAIKEFVSAWFEGTDIDSVIASVKKRLEGGEDTEDDMPVQDTGH